MGEKNKWKEQNNGKVDSCGSHCADQEYCAEQGCCAEQEHCTEQEHCAEQGCCAVQEHCSGMEHCCGSEEEESQEKLRNRIWISLLVFAMAILFPLMKFDSKIRQLLLFFTAYFIIGWDVVKKAVHNLFHGHFLDENFLMTLATIAAFATQEFPEGVMVMWLYKVGEWFQENAIGKSKKSIANLIEIRADSANLEKNGEVIEVKPEEVKIGDNILVKPGEKVPLDGVVVEGESFLDTVALTGESVPRKICIGEEIFSGCINQNGLLKIRVTKEFEESTVSQILELVEHASERKAKTENFISKFAKYYTPIVVVAALLLAIIPPLVVEDANWLEYIHRACSFLVISCPCALVISVPLGFFGGIGGASKIGILMKGSNYLEALSKVKTMVVDKTGTVTQGTFEVTKVQPVEGVSKEELVEIAALAEVYSEHPIAKSIRKAYGKEIEMTRISEAKEVAGHGVQVKIDGKIVLVGNMALMETLETEFGTIQKQQEQKQKQQEEKETELNSSEIGTIIYVAKDNQYLGNLVISDQIKPEAKEAISQWKNENGIQQVVMLTGDNLEVAKQVAKELAIDNVYAKLLPNQKVEKIEELLKEKKGNVAFVGDGMNDAPVLTRADIGIAMGGLGADAAIEAADIVIMDDDLSKIGTAIAIAKRTIRIVKQNILFSLLIKLIVLILGALGIANMWEAVFADVGVSLIAIMNSLRAMNVKKIKNAKKE